MIKEDGIAEQLGALREALTTISEGGPSARAADDYRSLREALMSNDAVGGLLPDFVVECRTPRDFWNYIQRAFKSYADRSRLVEAQLLPIERQFRPERQRAPGKRPSEVGIGPSPVRPVSATGLTFVSDERVSELRTLQIHSFDLGRLIRLCEELNVSVPRGLLPCDGHAVACAARPCAAGVWQAYVRRSGEQCRLEVFQ